MFLEHAGRVAILGAQAVIIHMCITCVGCVLSMAQQTGDPSILR